MPSMGPPPPRRAAVSDRGRRVNDDAVDVLIGRVVDRVPETGMLTAYAKADRDNLTAADR